MSQTDEDKERNSALWFDHELRLALLLHLVGKHLHEEVIIHDLTEKNKSITANDIAAALFFLAENQYVQRIDERFRLTKTGWEYLSAQQNTQGDTKKFKSDNTLIGFEEHDENRSYTYQSSYLNRFGDDRSERVLQFAILLLLLDVQDKFLRSKTKRQFTGASRKMLLDILGLSNLDELEYPIRLLLTHGYIEMVDRSYRITKAGIEFFEQAALEHQLALSYCSND